MRNRLLGLRHRCEGGHRRERLGDRSSRYPALPPGDAGGAGGPAASAREIDDGPEL